MKIEVLKSKLHRACVSGADLHYEGSISIDSKLLKAANMYVYERVDIYNINNGQRFSTYIIEGKEGEIALNGAAARLAMPGDRIIIATYTQIETDLASKWKPVVVLLDENNLIV
ncbi:MAG: aspartate 1-decarboxylase [Bacteroidales bacterium]|nr:aspartate 1-decarboxylase [Bacteroidales bacterium]